MNFARNPNRPMKTAICFREREHRSKTSGDPASSQRPDRLRFQRVWGPNLPNSSPQIMEQNTPNLGTESRTPYPDFPGVKHCKSAIFANVGSDTQTSRTAMDDTRKIRIRRNPLNLLERQACPKRVWIAHGFRACFRSPNFRKY